MIQDNKVKLNTKYKMWNIICYVIFACFAGVESWEDIEDFTRAHRDFFCSFLKMTG